MSLTFLYIEFICQLSNSICQLLMPFDKFIPYTHKHVPFCGFAGCERKGEAVLCWCHRSMLGMATLILLA